MSRAITREELFKEIELGNTIANEGIYISPEVIATLDFENHVQEQMRTCFDMNHETYTKTKLPTSIRLSSNFRLGFPYKHNARFSVQHENGKYYLLDGNNQIDEVTFVEKPKFYNHKTSDGVDMKTIANEVGKTKVTVAYSNECALKDKGLDCLFCNINATKALYGERDKVSWKTPKQIGETIAAGYKEDMETFLTVNPGLASRFSHKMHIDDYNEDELLAIYKKMAQKDNYKLSPEAEFKLMDLICRMVVSKNEAFGNAREMRNMLDQTIQQLSMRVSQMDPSEVTPETYQLIMPEDIREDI